MSANLNCTAWNFEMGLPNCWRCRAYSVAILSTAWVRLSERAAIEMRPTSSVRRNWLSPTFGSPTRWSSGTQASSKKSSRVSSPRQPMPRILGPIVKPGVSFSTTKLPNPGSDPPADSVRASSVTPNDMSVPAFEMKALRPLMSQPPSRRSARVLTARVSDPASGSVKPKAPSARPSANGRSHRSRCVSLPNRYSGSDPMVTCACHAVATDWSACPSSSMAATKPTVDMPIPPHSSGISMPRSPSWPISRSRSVGHVAASHAAGARTAISLVANSRQSSTSSASGPLSEKSMRALALRDELGRPVVELPRAVVVVEGVVVPAHELDGPAGFALQHEDHVADRLCLMVVPVRDEGVEDEVALGPYRLPPGVGLTKGVVAFEGADTRELGDAVGAVGGYDVGGPAVVQGMGVGGDGGADALHDLGVSLFVHKEQRVKRPPGPRTRAACPGCRRPLRPARRRGCPRTGCRSVPGCGGTSLRRAGSRRPTRWSTNR